MSEIFRSFLPHWRLFRLSWWRWFYLVIWFLQTSPLTGPEWLQAARPPTCGCSVVMVNTIFGVNLSKAVLSWSLLYEILWLRFTTLGEMETWLQSFDYVAKQPGNQRHFNWALIHCWSLSPSAGHQNKPAFCNTETEETKSLVFGFYWIKFIYWIKSYCVFCLCWLSRLS